MGFEILDIFAWQIFQIFYIVTWYFPRVTLDNLFGYIHSIYLIAYSSTYIYLLF